MNARQAILIGICLLLPSWAHATDFSYKNLVVASIKLNPDFDYSTYVDSLMEVFYPAVWQKARNDEFELHSKRDETVDKIKKAAADLNLNEPMIIHTTAEFGEYDFDSKKFYFSPLDPSTYFSQANCCNALPRQYSVYFENPDILDGLPMEPAAAKIFVDKHKNGGFVNRRVNLDIYVVIKSIKGDTEFTSEITKIVVKDSIGGNAVLLNLPKSGS